MKISLICGSSYHVINNKIKELSLNSLNITTYSLLTSTLEDIIESSSYYGLFNETKVIVIKDVKYFGGKFNYETESEILYNFLSNLDEDMNIIFICDSISKTKDLTKKVLNLGATIYDYTEIDEEIFNEVLNNYLETESIKIDDKALALLKENTLNNLDLIINEIEKISNKNSTITLDLVNTYGIKLDNLDTFEFSNAVTAKNFNVAFNLLDKLIRSGVDVYTLVGLLSSSFTNMYMVKDASSKGLSDEEIARVLGYSGTGRVYVMKKNGKIYTLDELKSIILSLADLDIKIKTGYNPLYEIKEFLLNL